MKIRLHRKRRIIAILILAAIICCLIISIYVQNNKEPKPQKLPTVEGQMQITILNSEGKEEKIYLEQFLIGVVAAEMPVSFEPEALKAQAIAARTYVLNYTPPYGTAKHGDAVVCCDSACCQAYSSDQQLRTKWGDNYQQNITKITAAVADTSGKVLTYQGQLALTPYCSTCGGHTESAADCWGNDIAYLQSVPCFWDDAAPRYDGVLTMSTAEAATALGVDKADLNKMAVTALSDSGRTEQVKIAKKSFTGSEIRKLLGLNSTAFTWLLNKDQIVFFTRGFGHGVGLCQYGANGMAKAGYTAEQILNWYYGGTTLQNLY